MNTDLSRVKTVIVTGPTASGKTELLASLFGRGASSFSGERVPADILGEQYLSAEVLSADSMQAYRGMDIGTAKPSGETLEILPHWLIDIKNPDEQYTAGEFVRRADALCETLHAKRILPVISGGTGFYVRNFLCGTSEAPPSNPEMRARVAGDLVNRGADYLRHELERADPVSAQRIMPNDTYRLTRAVEILRTSGFPPSKFAPVNECRGIFDFLVIGIERSRSDLLERIDRRVDAMFQAGLADEVASLKSRGYDLGCPGLGAIGYREFFEMDGEDEAEIASAIKLHTRQYAKRQMTFLRALPGIRWIPPDAGILASIVGEYLECKNPTD